MSKDPQKQSEKTYGPELPDARYINARFGVDAAALWDEASRTPARRVAMWKLLHAQEREPQSIKDDRTAFDEARGMDDLRRDHVHTFMKETICAIDDRVDDIEAQHTDLQARLLEAGDDFFDTEHTPEELQALEPRYRKLAMRKLVLFMLITHTNINFLAVKEAASLETFLDHASPAVLLQEYRTVTDELMDEGLIISSTY